MNNLLKVITLPLYPAAWLAGAFVSWAVDTLERVWADPLEKEIKP
jgi:hypothetical protein